MADDIVRPRSSRDTEHYWAGCREGELRFQICESCSEVVFHPRAVCPYCMASALQWRRSGGKGEVYSFSVQHVPLFRDKPFTPRVLGIIQLDEGFHMFSEIIGAGLDDVCIGARVEVEFEPLDDDYTLPKFRVAS